MFQTSIAPIALARPGNRLRSKYIYKFNCGKHDQVHHEGEECISFAEGRTDNHQKNAEIGAQT